jgi:hypothetical protein
MSKNISELDLEQLGVIARAAFGEAREAAKAAGLPLEIALSSESSQKEVVQEKRSRKQRAVNQNRAFVA